jgi:hypothetical protein
LLFYNFGGDIFDELILERSPSFYHVIPSHLEVFTFFAAEKKKLVFLGFERSRQLSITKKKSNFFSKKPIFAKKTENMKEQV